jgi:hypothetical protein
MLFRFPDSLPRIILCQFITSSSYVAQFTARDRNGNAITTSSSNISGHLAFIVGLDNSTIPTGWQQFVTMMSDPDMAFVEVTASTSVAPRRLNVAGPALLWIDFLSLFDPRSNGRFIR